MLLLGGFNTIRKGLLLLLINIWAVWAPGVSFGGTSMLFFDSTTTILPAQHVADTLMDEVNDLISKALKNGDVSALPDLYDQKLNYCRDLGLQEGWQEVIKEADSVAMALEDPVLLCRTELMKADLAFEEADITQAIRQYADVARCALTLQDIDLYVRALVSESNAYSHILLYDSVFTLSEEILKYLDEVKDPQIGYAFLMNLSGIHELVNNTYESERTLNKALDYVSAHNMEEEVAISLYFRLAHWYFDKDRDLATHYGKKVLEICDGKYSACRYYYPYLADAVKEEYPDSALALIRMADLTANSPVSDQLDALMITAAVYGIKGRYDSAITSCLAALSITGEYEEFHMRAGNFHEILSNLYSEVGDYKQALYHLNEFRGMYRQAAEAEYERMYEQWLVRLNMHDLDKDLSLYRELNKEKESRIRILVVFLVLISCALLLIGYLFYVLRKKTQELAISNATKDKLFHLIGHDLQSPLMILVEFGMDDELTESDVQFFKRDLIQLYQLTNNLVYWGLHQKDQIKLHPERFNLKELIGQTMHLPGSVARNKQIQMELVCDERLFIHNDKQLLQFVIRNLVNNALAFTPEGGKVMVMVQERGNLCEITIEDTGIGMDQVLLDQLLAEDASYVSTKMGGGLGITLSREFMDMMGGSIDASSEREKGTIFKVTFSKNI